MNDNRTVVQSNGIGASTILFFIFLVLKLTHVISWSWWWITAPLWIPFGLFVVISVVFMIIAGSL